MIFQIILYAVLKELVLLFASADFSRSSLPPVDFVCEYACVNLILESFTLEFYETLSETVPMEQFCICFC